MTPVTHVTTQVTQVTRATQTQATQTQPSARPGRVHRKRHRKRRRCGAEGCEKRLRLTSLRCRCGVTTCSDHRAPSRHSCTFDPREERMEQLREQVVRCEPVKLEKIE